jgi:hypothetical protein
MAINPQQELIWEGRIHLGDEPGIYGNAHYNGIAVELPITVYRMDPTKPQDQNFDLILETEDLETNPGYAGHELTVTAYEPDPAQPYHSVEKLKVSTRFVGADNNRKVLQVGSGAAPGPFFFTVRLRSDTSVNPGFYDDYKVIRLSLGSNEFYASFGFRNA